jgi:AbrB family looped-hinge helix DNA binding protein
MPQLLDVAHVSKKGVSMRMTLPRIIRERLKIKDGDILGFYEDNGDIIIKKMD